MSFGSESEWVGDTGIRLEANRLPVPWCVDHTLSEILREGLSQSSTASRIGQDCFHNPAFRWLEMREIRIELSARKRLGGCQIKVSFRWQQLAGRQLIARFPY